MKINHHPPGEKHAFLVKRFRHFLWVTLLLSVLSIVNIIASSGETKSANTIVISLGISSILTSFYLIRLGKESFARALFLWSVAFAITYLALINGGLRDTSLLVYPILIFYSALLGGQKIFLLMLLFLIISIVLLGANTINGWVPYTLVPLGWEQVLDGVLINLLAAYIAWTVNTDMQTTLHHLNNENKKVIKSHETIQLMVERDSLTGLLNRSACELHYQTVQRELATDEEQIILFFLDLDNFKNINDSFGHNAGDELLIAISNELKKLLLPSDIASRLGGDEFVLIIKRGNVFDIDQFANNILKVITTPYNIYDTTIRMTGSVGIAITPNDGNEFDEVRKKSDIAMYKSKQLGKNTFSYYSSHLHEETLRKNSILNGLKDSLEKNLLDLHFQPKVNLSTGRIESAEALIRWNRGNPHNFRPDDFIPVVESTELIHEIGKWCIEEACKICKQWHNTGFNNMSISVNASSVQFMRSNFKDLVFNALQKSNLEPQFLEIELTEHVLIQHSETVKNQLKSLKKNGVKLSIDDFGTGYSNLSYLINFKVDTIKLDKSFVAKVNTSSEHLAVVKAIIQMAKILNLNVVAEGVESESVKRILIDLKCDYAQGFLWSRGLPESEFMKTVNHFNNTQSHILR